MDPVQRHSLVNKRFNAIKVLSINSKVSKEKGETYLNCICSCGSKIIVYGYLLRTGLKQSCGCKLRKSYLIKKSDFILKKIEEIETFLKFSKTNKKTTNVSLAWAAGFFDGEGCTTVTHFKNLKKTTSISLSLRSSLAQVEKEPLINFLSSVKIGTIRGPYKYSTNRQNHYQWNASGMDVIKLITKLWPYLSSPKRKQALKNINNYYKHLKNLRKAC